MEGIKRIMLANRAWSKERLAVNPAYFQELAAEHQPEFLWIGCADNRVGPEEITGATPGDLLVHCNVGNLVVHTDLNLLSLVQFAVEQLDVPHIIVCGHYGCSGIQAALSHNRFGLLNKWIRHIKDTHRLHRAELDLYENPSRRCDRLVELNVLEQVQNLCKTSIIQQAWRDRNAPTVHGWIFGRPEGMLDELVVMKPGMSIDDIYVFDFDD